MCVDRGCASPPSKANVRWMSHPKYGDGYLDQRGVAAVLVRVFSWASPCTSYSVLRVLKPNPATLVCVTQPQTVSFMTLSLSLSPSLPLSPQPQTGVGRSSQFCFPFPITTRFIKAASPANRAPVILHWHPPVVPLL